MGVKAAPYSGLPLGSLPAESPAQRVPRRQIRASRAAVVTLEAQPIYSLAASIAGGLWSE